MNIFLGEEICRTEICQPKTPRYAEDWKVGEIVFKVVRNPPKKCPNMSVSLRWMIDVFGINDIMFEYLNKCITDVT